MEDLTASVYNDIVKGLGEEGAKQFKEQMKQQKQQEEDKKVNNLFDSCERQIAKNVIKQTLEECHGDESKALPILIELIQNQKRKEAQKNATLQKQAEAEKRLKQIAELQKKFPFVEPGTIEDIAKKFASIEEASRKLEEISEQRKVKHLEELFPTEKATLLKVLKEKKGDMNLAVQHFQSLQTIASQSQKLAEEKKKIEELKEQVQKAEKLRKEQAAQQKAAEEQVLKQKEMEQKLLQQEIEKQKAIQAEMQKAKEMEQKLLQQEIEKQKAIEAELAKRKEAELKLMQQEMEKEAEKQKALQQQVQKPVEQPKPVEEPKAPEEVKPVQPNELKVTLTATPIIVDINQQITVEFEVLNGQSTSSDWVGMYLVSDPPLPNKKYITSQYRGINEKKGVMTFYATIYGKYEFRYLRGYNHFAKTETVSVGPEFSITAEFVEANAEKKTPARIVGTYKQKSGNAYTTAWVGLYLKGSTSYVTYENVKVSSAGQVSFNVPPKKGEYELRFFSQKYELVSTSNAIAI